VLLAAVELARDLDRVERVASRRLRDAHERRSRKGAPELVREHAVKRGDRKRTQLEELDPAIALEGRDRRPRELRRANREEAPDGFVAEQAERELDHRG
jgi:hypothetical protein